MKIVYKNKQIGGNCWNYNTLVNKPYIGETELIGDLTLDDIDVYSQEEVQSLIASIRTVRVVATLPTSPDVNTLYYIGPDSEGNYQMTLIDNDGNQIDLGKTTKTGLYKEGQGIDISSANLLSVKTDGKTVVFTSEDKIEAKEMTGATTSAAGKSGIVPAPAIKTSASDHPQVLENDGTWSDDFVKATGDEMTGNLKMKSSKIELEDSSSYIQVDVVGATAVASKSSAGKTFFAGGAAQDDGAALGLYGKDNPESDIAKGAFALLANNGTNSCLLWGFPNGTMTWNDKYVCVSPVADEGPTYLTNTSRVTAGNFSMYVKCGVLYIYSGAFTAAPASGDSIMPLCTIPARIAKYLPSAQGAAQGVVHASWGGVAHTGMCWASNSTSDTYLYTHNFEFTDTQGRLTFTCPLIG